MFATDEFISAALSSRALNSFPSVENVFRSARSNTDEGLQENFTCDFLKVVLNDVFSCISGSNNQSLVTTSRSTPTLISIFLTRIYNKRRIGSTKAISYTVKYYICSVPNPILLMHNQIQEEERNNELDVDIHEEDTVSIMTIG